MSLTKSKKKSKSAQIPKPIKIKREDDHVMNPMEHYVDDRVELIRQIFSSLKPKTITNLAPDFLKKSKLEDIQEQCLNEILGISKKRLLSIINSTKCPTDTETSEDEVHSVDEHISLEEISSDSDIAEQKGQKTTRADGKKKQKVKREADSEGNKQFSVLELLELQARARAIRSQLALEPVTKIEVDTDSDEDETSSKKSSTQAAPSRKKTGKTANGRPTPGKTDSSKRSVPAQESTSKQNSKPVTAPTKRIKLKRNFRKQTHNDESADDAKAEESNPKASESSDPKKERSPSPDVIPIVAVPETLCISDSDEEKSPEKEKEVPKEIAAPKPEAVEILSVVNIEAPLNVEEKLNDSPKKTEPTEPEEGEITDEEITKEEIESSNKEKKTEKSTNKDVDLKEVREQTSAKESEDTSTPNIEPTTSNSSKDKENPKGQTTDSSTSDSDDSDANDDIISLEGGDLLNEMKVHLEEEIEETSQPNEVICLDDSSEEEIKDKKSAESWNDRYLKSSKVSKVLLASRLGNRVRNKIKETRKAQKLEEAAVKEAEQAKPQEEVFASKHEDGSVEQYKEILDKAQKKTD